MRARNAGRATRRRLLGAAGATLGATTLAGCGSFANDPQPEPADPVRAVHDEALTLAAAYDRAVVTQPALARRLSPLAADHRAHAAELARVTGSQRRSAFPPASSSAPAGDAAGVLAELRTAEQAAQRTAVTACQAAAANRAALIGSIAASRATHAEALR